MSAEEELQTIRKAHKILIRKLTDIQNQNKDVDKKTKVDLSDFINYTTVNQMLDSKIGYMASEMPQVKKDIIYINRSIDKIQN